MTIPRDKWISTWSARGSASATTSSSSVLDVSAGPAWAKYAVVTWLIYSAAVGQATSYVLKQNSVNILVGLPDHIQLTGLEIVLPVSDGDITFVGTATATAVRTSMGGYWL